jgi:uncharacterized protein (DUF924 family)
MARFTVQTIGHEAMTMTPEHLAVALTAGLTLPPQAAEMAAAYLALPERSVSERAAPADAEATVAFWRDAGPSRWFAKDADFDRAFREKFLRLHERAACEALPEWLETPIGSLALAILLDQFPRNAFRGTARMYATDALARQIADAALASGHDQRIEAHLRLFLGIPFAHSEDLRDQERSVALARTLGEPTLSHAKRHREIIRRFGRFPHRNPILGRAMTEDEQRYLAEGGFNG